MQVASIPRFVPLVLLVLATGPASGSPEQALLIPRMSVSAPPGWARPIVPRMTGDATSSGTVAVAESLLSTQPTYINWSTWKNPAVCGLWTDQLYLDGALIESLARSDCEWAEKFFPAVNQGPTIVRGGRHELSAAADVYWQVVTDYDFRPFPFAAQWVWSPTPLARNSPALVSTPPPQAGTWPQPNCDGYQLTRANPWAWVADAMASNSSDNHDLIVYADAWQGGTSGFSVEGARSQRAAGAVDFVVGAASGQQAYFPAVIRGAGPPHGGYLLGWTDAENRRDSTASADWTVSLPASRLAAVHEMWLAAGQTVRLDMTRLAGSEDLALAVFPPTPGGVWERDQALANSAPSEAEEHDALIFTASEAGWHPVVVYRAEGTVGQDVHYHLVLGPGSATGPGAPGSRFYFSDPAPNPVRDRARFAFGLPTDGPVRLAIYDLGGRLVATLVDATLAGGPHEAQWDLRDLGGDRAGSGVYWVRLEADRRTVIRRLTVLR